MKSKGVFVTGTDTGVGKTVVSTILALGLDGIYWKPIQSGTNEETDSEFVARYLGRERVFAEAYRLNEALSPHHAARIDGVEICLNDIELKPSREFLIVEGAGGVLVPINDKVMMIDLIEKLKLPALVVCRSGLGTLNHTLLTLRVLRTHKIPIFGTVMVGPLNKSNRATIEKLGQVQTLMEVEIFEMSKENLERSFRGFSWPKENWN